MSLKEKNFNIDEACGYMENFIKTYRSNQDPFYKDFTMDTYLLDLLYGVGVSISKEYRMANGFTKFKKDLVEYIQDNN